jgi:translation initiation factor IF-2
VVETEAGGITQHTGAYQVEKNGQLITFLDTPGHEAFTAMRSRGAQITDLAILVVAADDGVMPQTVEALNHAKAADVPIIVAINKTDRPGANPDRVRQQLADHELLSEDWGGSTVTVEVSALKKAGIEDLLEMVLLVAEMAELKANPDRPAVGSVIEAELDRNRGSTATVLIQNGTLRTGDMVVAGSTSGRVRAMFDYRGRSIKEAGPSVPVSILGLEGVPAAGDRVEVLDDERAARQLAEKRSDERKDTQKAGRLRLSELFSKIEEGVVKDLNIIVKADVQGTVEALGSSLEKLSDDRVRVNVIHAGTGGITETDVVLASASNAIIIGFNVRPEPDTRRAAEREEVDIRLYRVIYEALDDIKAAMTGLLEPEYEEAVLGRAEVRATFRVPNIGTIAGCYVTDGRILRNALVRVLRDQVVIYEGKISSLKRFKDDVREVLEGYECGIGIERFNDVKEGDHLEAYHMRKVEP